MSDADHFAAGVALFNAAQFWHAHEAWEDGWKSSADPGLRLFYKGIIQAAAALVHWQRGNPRGLHRNWDKARPKLVASAPGQLGLAVAPLIAAMDQFVAADGVGHKPPQLHVVSTE